MASERVRRNEDSPAYRYSTNFEVVIAANGLDEAHRIATQIRDRIRLVEGVVQVHGGIYPRHRNDLDHALAEPKS